LALRDIDCFCKHKAMNAGEKTIEWLYRENLHVDQEWSVKLPQGFTWWADQNAQRLEVIGAEFSRNAEEETFFVRVRTELLRDLVLNEKSLPIINQYLMSLASMSGPVYDAANGILSLSSLVRTYESIRGWMSHVISMAAVLQIAEARAVGPELADMLGATFATSGHPKNGKRPIPDELAGDGLHALITAEGAKPCAWTEQFREADDYIHAPPSLLSTGDEEGFTAEFPWDDFSSLCRFKGDELHPRYGRGLFLRQAFSVRVNSELDGIKLALELNAQELGQIPYGYGLGSYFYNHGCLHFVGFYPNFIHRNVLIKNMYFASVNRAHAMSSLFAGDDWSEQFIEGRPPKAKSATEISLRLQHSSKVAGKIKQEEVADTKTYGSCLYCRQDLEKGACQHWIASLDDDSDGHDTVTPLYFGWADYCGKVHEEMIVSIDNYFEGLCGVCDQVIKKGPSEVKRVLRAAKDFPLVEEATLRDATKLLDQPEAGDYEAVRNLLGALDRELKALFTDFVLRGGGKATNWEIPNPPPVPSWSGTNYWAEDAERCVGCIIQESRKATDRLRKLVRKS
jgi:hypothetical protein